MTFTTLRPSSARLSDAMTPSRLTSAVTAAIAIRMSVVAARLSRSRSSSSPADTCAGGRPGSVTVGVTSAWTLWNERSPPPTEHAPGQDQRDDGRSAADHAPMDRGGGGPAASGVCSASLHRPP